MKKLITKLSSLLLFVLFCLSLMKIYAQKPNSTYRTVATGIGTIKGVITDETTSSPIEFATLAAFRDTLLVTGTITDAKGSFSLEGLGYGQYRLKINFIGFSEKNIDSVRIIPSQPNVILNRITLSPGAVNLSEANVEGEKSIVQSSIDKKVFNVEKSIVSQGGTAGDVLKQVPSVNVDIDGNISLRGSSNVTVLIDGKPSAMTGASRTAVLEQLPANTIESVEVITNPSVKYDPDGMAGIINIVLKKNKKKGYNGSLTLNAGTRNKYNPSVNAGYNNGKLNITGNYSFRYAEFFNYRYGTRETIYNGVTTFLDNRIDGMNYITMNFGKAAIEYSPNEKNTFSFSASVNKSSQPKPELIAYKLLNAQKIISNIFTRENYEFETSSNYDFSGGYRKLFAKPKHEINFSMSFSDAQSINTLDAIQKEYNPDNSFNRVSLKMNNSTGTKNNVSTLQADYVHPLNNDAKFETGYKSTYRKIDSDLNSKLFDMQVSDWKKDTGLSNHFIYTEQMHGVYGIYSGRIKNFGYQGGVRAEQTLTGSEQQVLDTNYQYNYFNIFPSVHLSQKFRENHEVLVSYSRRINRPHPHSLNPINNYSDPQNVFKGNPKLRPEYINSYEAGYIRYMEKGMLNPVLFYRQTLDMITRIRYAADSTGASRVTFENLNTSVSYGLDFNFNYSAFRFWNFNINLSGFRTELSGSNTLGEFNNTNYGWSGKFISNLKLKDKGDLQLSYNYRSSMPIPQGFIHPMHGMDIGIKINLLKGRGTGSVNIADVFNTRQFSVEAYDKTFNATMVRKRETQIVYLNFTYRIGTADKSAQQRSKRREGGEMPGEEMF